MNNALVSLLTSQLGVNAQQASGGAGLLLSMAKDKLSGQEFGQIANAVPGVDSLLAAAPSGAGGGLGGMLGKVIGGRAGDLASLAGGFSKLGMDPAMIQKFVPVVMGYLQQQGGAGVGALLQQALKR